LDFAKNKLPLQPILRFINNLMKNPSRRAVQELYKFLEHKNMPITPEGNFLAYKGVQADYYSKTAGNIIVIKGTVKDGKIYNGIGEVIEVERNGVCDDKNLGCSSGLHAGSVAYATEFGRGGKVVIVEINPADVVSVPDDCNCQKLRACRYKVVGEYEIPLDHNYNNSYSHEDWTDDYGDGTDEESCDDDGDESYDDYGDGTEQCTCPACLAELEAENEQKLEEENQPFASLFPPIEPTAKVQKPNMEEYVQKTVINTADALRDFADKLNQKAQNPTATKEEISKNLTAAVNALRDAINKKLGS